MRAASHHITHFPSGFPAQAPQMGKDAGLSHSSSFLAQLVLQQSPIQIIPWQSKQRVLNGSRPGNSNFSDRVKRGVGFGFVTRICGVNGRPARKRRIMKFLDLPDRDGLPSSQRCDMNRSISNFLGPALVEWVSWVGLSAMQWCMNQV